MASAKNKDHLLVEDAFPPRRLSGGGIGSSKHKKQLNHQPMPNDTAVMDNNCPAALQQQHLHQHQVLKEKMPNNIITAPYDSVEEWTNENDIISDFIDVKDIDALDKLKFNDAKEAKLRQMHQNSKRKMRTRSDLETNHEIFYKLLPTDAWVDADLDAGKANNKYEKKNMKVVEVVDAGDDCVAVTYKAKLPLTPKKANGVTAVKKHSPPVHRVLLYNNPSPRLPRVTSSSLRVQEMRRVRSKSPSNLADKKQFDYTMNRLGDNVLGNVPKVDTKNIPNHLARHMQNGGDGGVADVIDNDASSNDDDYDDLDNVSDFGDSADTDATTSDSEDGYRTHVYKMAHAANRTGSSPNSSVSFQTFEESLKNPESLLVPSLFPFVPPYLAFSSNISKGPEVPPELYRVLKWRVSTVMPRVVRLVLTNSGMRLVKKTNDWMGVWGKHMKSPCFKTIRPYQKINHLPGSFKIGRKDACWRNLQKQMNKHGKKDFGFMPKTYIIPRDLNLLRKNWPKYAQRNVKWIIKPPASARGAGIRVVDRWAQIPKRKPLIVQKYIERPFLINGSKFDLRLYVLVTSINPLRVFLYHNGLARFASVKYSDKSDTLHDRCMHLTNYSINKFSSNYSKNEDVNACHGHKWTIKSLWSYLANRGVRTEFLWEALRNLVLRTIMAGEQSINNMLKVNVESRYSCFELFGFDVLLDADLIPWLLEVNISPSLHSELPLDAHVKAPLVQAVLNTALYHVPPKLSQDKQKEISVGMSLPPGPICYDKRLYINYLSRAEKIKHNTFTRKTMEDRDEYINSILDNLTPDDIRCLIVAEDELARSSPLERIFPTNQTYKYLKYNDTPRYYNRLLDAWETRYGHNRSEGIAVLREFCELKYHLEVPPSPAKKQLKYRTRALRVTRATGLALNTRHMKSMATRKSRRIVATNSKMPIFKLIRPLQIENNQDVAATTTTEDDVAEISKDAEHQILKMPNGERKRSSYSIKIE